MESGKVKVAKWPESLPSLLSLGPSMPLSTLNHLLLLLIKSLPTLAVAVAALSI